MTVRLIIDGAEVQSVLRSPDGPVFRYLARQGDQVIADARPRIHSKTGRLAASLVKRPTTGPNGLAMMVVAGAGLNPSYALWVHEGNGPPGSRIFPKRHQFLKFQSGGRVVFARSVRTSEPNPFLRDALQAIG